MEKILQTIKRFIPKKLFKLAEPLYHFLLGVTANIFYRWPSDKLVVIGVTGTTGKTTTVYLIAKMLEGAGFKVGYTSTAMFGDGNKEWLNDKKMTMIGRFFTHKMLRSMVDNGCQFAVVETSSEGIVQYRHRFINYDVVLITGLYPEHIEAHGSFENYKEAKGMLFAHLKDCKTKYVDDDFVVRKPKSGLQKTNFRRVKKTIIVHGADEHAQYFLDFWSEKKYEFRLSDEKPVSAFDAAVRDVVAEAVEKNDRNYLSLQTGDMAVRLLGAFNRRNLLAALTVGFALRFDLSKLKGGLEKIDGVPGRLERIDEGQPFTVVVDYAFEPKAVEKLYETIEAMPHGRIIHVLGSAGGGRDKARRPILGALAGKRAAIAIVTDEDPYDEDPMGIIAQVAVGAENAGKQPNVDLFSIIDRREAIRKALRMAREGDTVLITGKGSEQAICRARGQREAWDDRKVVREELALLERTVDN